MKSQGQKGIPMIGAFEIPAKLEFQNTNDGIIKDEKTKLPPLIEEYNKKAIIVTLC